VISYAAPGSVVGEISSAVSKSVTADQQITYVFSFDISDKGVEGPGVPPETLWINLKSTSITGEAYGMVFTIGMLSWRDGRHV